MVQLLACGSRIGLVSGCLWVIHDFGGIGKLTKKSINNGTRCVSPCSLTMFPC